jgi:hypothetical protein
MRWRLMLVVSLFLVACTKPYRVGDYVLVEWEEGGAPYPAYIIEIKSERVFRVHFDGYETRWDEDVTTDRVLGRVEGPVPAPPPPKKVARAAGASPKAAGSATTAPYRVGDRVKVRWRESVYNASIVAVVAPDRFLVHYDGHESAWDEVVNIDRIVSRR